MGQGYFARWRGLSRAARLYLVHAGLLTSSLAISGLLFNLYVLALGYPRNFLGTLNSVSLLVAAALSVPLWWLVTRIGLRQALVASAVLQVASAVVFALFPAAAPLLLAVSFTGASATLFQVSSPPFMMEHSDDAGRDHLFSANAAINVGFAGLASLVGGQLPALFGRLLGVGAESEAAYRATFGVVAAGLVLSLVPLLMIETGPKQEESQPRNEDDREAARVEDDSAEPAGQAQPWWIGRIERLLGRVPEPWRGMLRHPVPILQLLVPPFFISWGAALLIPYLNIFFKERFDVSDGVLGVIFAALGITTGLSALLGPVLSARIGKSRTIVVAQALSIPFLLTMGYVPLLSVAVGAALMRGVLFNMGSPLYDAFAMERTGAEARPAVIGLINGAYSVGYLVAPIISTLVQERYGFGPLFVATAICYGLAVVATYWFFVRQRNETAKNGQLNRQDAKIAKS